VVNGQHTLFLNQVDDFAIATSNKETAVFIISKINAQLHLPLHIMGIVTRFNGIDIEQMQEYVKVNCHNTFKK
jgi:hypothetical protein